MYPLRYFAPVYFPPRYFPEVGVTPAPVGSGEIKLMISGVERTDYIYYARANSWNLTRGNRGSCTLSLIVAPGDSFSPQASETLEIYDPRSTRVWAGTVEAIDITWIGDDGWHVIAVTGVSLEQLYDSSDLNKIEYTPTTPLTPPQHAGDIVADLHARSGVTEITLGTIDAGPEVQSLQVSNTWRGFLDLAVLAGFVVYVDPADKKLYFHAPLARAAAWTVASEDMLWESMQYHQSRADYRDTQVLQLPGVAQSPVTASFAGDNTTTSFTLPSVPSFIVSVQILPGGLDGAVIGWAPGSDKVTVTPAMAAGSTLVVQYADVSGQVTVTNPAATAIGIGSRTARYTKTRSFTAAGVLQEATAMLARYSMLPSTLVFQTDKPGIAIARALPIAITAPLEAGARLNGTWLVMEIEARIVEGLDLQAEPFGHFRYTLHLVNAAPTAIFHGDTSTTTFLLPEVPSAVQSIRVQAAGVRVAGWIGGTNQITVTPALNDDESVAVDYRAAAIPDVPSYINTWEHMPGGGPLGGSDQLAPSGLDAGSQAGALFAAELSLTDLTVGDDPAPHTVVYHAGTAVRGLAVLRVALGADLTVRINKNGNEIVTVLIPSSTAVDDVLEFVVAAGSPPVTAVFEDKDVLSADILESDGATDRNGIVTITLEWQGA